ncbi:MAG: hypothetical protein HDS66_08375 [Bacteroidales bacterium]|nr:hypothetical protein [Bacteroidales bacterium]
MDAIQDRLTRFISSLNSSVLSFENRCGIAPGTVSKMTANSRPKTFNKISDAFPQLNIDWLKTGEGEMLRTNYTQTIHGGEKIVQHGTLNIQGEPQGGNEMLSALLRTQDLLAQTLQTLTQTQATQAATQATQAQTLQLLTQTQATQAETLQGLTKSQAAMLEKLLNHQSYSKP